MRTSAAFSRAHGTDSNLLLEGMQLEGEKLLKARDTVHFAQFGDVPLSQFLMERAPWAGSVG
jgi:hypothetical protein